MRRKRRRETGVAVSLFPFLAVLICTMGVLIVMLVMAVSSSADKAQDAKIEQAEQFKIAEAALLDELDLEEFRVRSLSQMRPNLKRRLEAEKLKRSHLDDEIIKLTDEFKALNDQFEVLTLDNDAAQESQAADSQQISDLKKQIEQRRLDLAALKQEVKGRPVLYSIVPTKTAAGTDRRPIYIECTADGIVLRPSGIRISLDDFTKPILPGNPLDVGLLTTREYWNRFDSGDSLGEPYPLIVVRPGGATSYAIARRAMSSWDDEFGYELVEQSKQLNWGDVDSNLTRELQKAIAIAKNRQIEQVAAGLASWFSEGSRSSSSLAGQPLSGGSRGGEMVAPAGSERPSDRIGNADRGESYRQGSSGFKASSRNSGSRKNSTQSEQGSFNGIAGNPERLDTSKDDSLSRFASAQDTPTGRPLTTQAAMQASAKKSSGNTSGGNVGSKFQQDPVALSQKVPEVAPLSESRGENWALPTRTPGATPYRRPIRVDCFENYYLVHRGGLERDTTRIAINDSVNIAIDELVNEVWNQIEGWGMAEIGGYWKPVLRLTTTDIQGASKADELARKLENSGIEVERQWR